MDFGSAKVGTKPEYCVRAVLLFSIVLGVCFFGQAAARGSNSESEQGEAFRVLSVKPTVLLVREQGSLLQAADVEVESESELVGVSVDVKFGSRQRSTGIATREAA